MISVKTLKISFSTSSPPETNKYIEKATSVHRLNHWRHIDTKLKISFWLQVIFRLVKSNVIIMLKFAVAFHRGKPCFKRFTFFYLH